VNKIHMVDRDFLASNRFHLSSSRQASTRGKFALSLSFGTIRAATRILCRRRLCAPNIRHHLSSLVPPRAVVGTHHAPRRVGADLDRNEKTSFDNGAELETYKFGGALNS
jgi:hypothetical protein